MPLDSIWLRPESAGVGRRAEHTRAEITAAAVAIADEDGFTAVTMRRVAVAIGTGAASLYRYVHNRGELVALMIDAIYREMNLRRTGDGWRADLVEVGREGMRAGLRHPWFIDAVMENPFAPGPGTARLAEHCLGILSGHPASVQRKLEAIGVMGGMVQSQSGFVARNDMAEMMAASGAYLIYAAGDGNHPYLAAAFDDPTAVAAPAEDPVEQLARILGMVFDGILGPAGQAAGSAP